MDKETIINVLRSEKQHLHERFHVSELGLFGSCSRGEQTDTSDIDVLVDFDGSVNLFDLVDMEEYLTSRLNRNVDVVSDVLPPPTLTLRGGGFLGHTS